MTMPRTVPWAELDTIFFDAGNTFLSMDFERVAETAAEVGISCTGLELERAEAAARPVVSAALAEGRTTEGADAFKFYLAAMLGELPEANSNGAVPGIAAEELARLLFAPGRNDMLWNRRLPGRPRALGRIRALGYRMVVVSNSDGSMERSVEQLGLERLFDGIVDSTVVGFEKPDPRIFQAALGLVGADPARTLHVGDLYAADVVGARAAGIHAVLLDPFDDWPRLDCPKVADLAELADLLPGPPGRLPCGA